MCYVIEINNFHKIETAVNKIAVSLASDEHYKFDVLVDYLFYFSLIVCSFNLSTSSTLFSSNKSIFFTMSVFNVIASLKLLLYVELVDWSFRMK